MKFEQTEENLHLMTRVFEHSGEAIAITGPDNTILATNGAFSRLTGYSREEALGCNPRILQSGRESGEFYRIMWECLLRENFWQGEIWDKRKDGSLYPKWLAIAVVRNAPGKITHYIARFADLSERKQSAKTIKHLAHYDTLTSLPNRFCLRERLTRELESARLASGYLAVAFINLDGFKQVNDSCGIYNGDRLLFHVAARLLESATAGDIVARYGGDEFVIVLSRVETAAALLEAVNRIQQALAPCYPIDGHDLHVTPSIGTSAFPKDGAGIEALVKNASLAMRHAKAKGGDNHKAFTQDMDSKARERLQLLSEPRTAIIREEFLLHYQPQIEAATGRLVGVEALVRWQHPRRGLIGPDFFIPLAEETGLILPIGDWVLETACRQLALQGAGSSAHGRQPVCVSIQAGEPARPNSGYYSKGRSRPAPAGVGDHRNSRHGESRSGHQAPAQAESDGGGTGDRRFRHRLFLAQLSEAFPRQPPEDRPLLREGHRDQPR